MSYVLKITNTAGDCCGYISASRSRVGNKSNFLTYDGRRVQRFASRHKAYDRAGRYNAMNAERGFTANVVPLTQEIEDAR